MRLDLPTLLTATVLVTGLTGSLLVFSWHQNRKLDGLAWWGVGTLIASLAAALLGLRGTIADVLSIDAANAVMLSAYGVFWSGTRVFEGRPLRPGWAASGAALWLVACQIEAFHETTALRVILVSSLVGVYALATAGEFWRGRAEGLASRYPAILLLGLHAFLSLGRIPFAVLIPFPADGRSFQGPWVAFLALEALLYAVGMAFVLLAMSKERVEREHRIAASTDDLTGVANRRAFLARARAVLAKAAPGAPIALLLFDLDHFKRINDSHGHDMGDRVLLVFSRTALAHLGPNAMLGRLGGEEFACIVPDCTAREALRLGERIRQDFAALPFSGQGGLFRATTSVGVATIGADPPTLAGLLSRADLALYRGKAEGRNRVVLSGPAQRPHEAQAA